MSSASIKKIIPCKKNQLIEMVLDIEKYPAFVPWCLSGKVHSRNESSDLIITRIFVDSGRMLKRMQPAPQGRAHRIRKRSNHVTIMVGLKDID